MPVLPELQRCFAAALRDTAAIPPVASSQRRFNVHRNNVSAGILGVLESRFPVVRRLVGDDFYRAMATDYVAQEPPVSPILMLYGVGFPAFVRTFAPAADTPYLADVALLEWLQHDAYHAADASPIGAQDLAAVPADRIADLRLVLHPSLRLFASDLPALSIWQMNLSTQAVTPVKLAARAEHALVVRPLHEVEVHRTDAALHAFAGQLDDGQSLGAATEFALSRAETFNVQSALSQLIAMGAIAGHELPWTSGPG
jgi:hypothetical protein